MTEEIELNPLSLQRTKSRQMPKNKRGQLTHELIKRNTMIMNQNGTRLKTSPFILPPVAEKADHGGRMPPPRLDWVLAAM